MRPPRFRWTISPALALLVLLIAGAASLWRLDTADEWAALGAWITAGVAVAAGLIAWYQLGEARQPRLAQAQPYVIAFMADNPDRPKYVDLVIRNFGLTAATDVRVEIKRSPRRARFAGEPCETVAWPAHIPVLVPGQEWLPRCR
jgi:hypothetical protein